MKKQEGKKDGKTPLLNKISRAISHMWRRFPEAFVCLIAFLATIIVGIAIEDNFTQLSILSVIIRILGWGILIGVDWRLFWETEIFQNWLEKGKHLKKWPKWLWGILVVVLGVGLIYSLAILLFNLLLISQTDNNLYIAWWGRISQYWQIGLTLILLLGHLTIPLLGRRKGSSQLALYLFQQAVLSTLFGGIIYVGLTLAGMLCGWLFDFEWWQAQPYVSVIVLIGFEVTYFLATFPGRSADLTKWDAPKIWKVLLVYIAAPLMLLYDLILYVYLIVSAFKMTWPEGGVVNLILWFGILAIVLTFLISLWTLGGEDDPDDKKWQRVLTRIFNWSLVPLAIVAAVGIGIRVWDQGWTMNRWLVVMGLVWIVGSVIILSARWRKGKVWLWPWLMMIVLAGIIGGPLLTQISQKSRLGNDWLKKSSGYSRNFDGGFFDENDEDEEDKEISFYYHGDKNGTINSIGAIDLRDYDLLLAPVENEEAINSSDSGQIVYRWLESKSEEATDLDERVGRLVISLNGEPIYDYDLGEKIAELNQKCQNELLESGATTSNYSYGCKTWQDPGKGGLEATDLIIHHEANGLAIDYYLENWSGDYNPDTGESQLNELYGLALVSWPK